MNTIRFMGLALSAAMAGTALGCAPAIPNAESSFPKAPAMTEGTVHPDQLIQGDRQIMVKGQALTFDEFRKQMPSRISDQDAAKLLVEIDPSKITQGSMETQQSIFRSRGHIRGWGGFRHRGFFGTRRFRYFGYGGLYYPYYSYANYWYPYSYAYGGCSAYPYLYGYGGSYYPYSYYGGCL